MMSFYLIGNENGTRFIPSSVLPHVLPCMVHGVLSVDDDHSFSVGELHSFNTVVSEIFKSDYEPDSNKG